MFKFLEKSEYSLFADGNINPTFSVSFDLKFKYALSKTFRCKAKDLISSIL